MEERNKRRGGAQIATMQYSFFPFVSFVAYVKKSAACPVRWKPLSLGLQVSSRSLFVTFLPFCINLLSHKEINQEIRSLGIQGLKKASKLIKDI
jgi:hypothetical protein